MLGALATMQGYNVAVVGATGVVGETMIRVLEERKFPVDRLLPLASEASCGKNIRFKGREIPVEKLTKDSFHGIDFALFSAGGEISLEYARYAVASNAVVVDNSAAFRMEKDVLLIVPEVNGHLVKKGTRAAIIANPNCSTIQLVCALKPIHDAAIIRRVVVSTYQSVSGAGRDAMIELANHTKNISLPDIVAASGAAGDCERISCADSCFAHPIAFDCLPHIDKFEPNGYTKEEMKVVRETQKILGDDSIAVTCTAVRVPVFISHSESVNVETLKELACEKAKEILANAKGVVVCDDPSRSLYPRALAAAGKDEVFVGRIRRDESRENCLNMWIVSDNVRKGAATNAVQILELLI